MHAGALASLLTGSPGSMMVASRLGLPSRTVVNTGTTGGGTATQFQQQLTFMLQRPAQSLNLRFANLINDPSVLSQLNVGVAAVSIRGGIGLTASSTPKPLFVAGAPSTRDLSLAAAAFGDMTCDLGKMVAANTRLYLQEFATFASVPANWPATDIIMSQGTEFNEFGTALTDRSGAAWTSGSRTTNYALLPPVAIWAPGKAPSVAILGDSIGEAGNNDTTFGDGIGWVQRGLNAAGIPWVGNGAQGMTIGAFISSTPQMVRRLDMLASAGITHIICTLCTNDISGGASDTVIKTNMGLLRSYAAKLGMKVILCTPPPRTNPANTAQQTGDNASAWTWIQNYKAWVLTNPFGLPVIDINSVWRDGTNLNLWRTDLGTPTSDGIHPATALHTAGSTLLSGLIATGLLL